MENGWTPKVSVCSSLENIGINKIWETITTHNSQMKSSAWKSENRKSHSTTGTSYYKTRIRK